MNTLRRIFHLDHLVITLLAFLVVLVIGWLCASISFLNPVMKALDEFALTDIYYNVLNEGERRESREITLVDVTDLHYRGDIAAVIETVNKARPAAIGLDLVFDGEKDDPVGNLLLANAIRQTPRLVTTDILNTYDPERQTYTSAIRSFFISDDEREVKEGYANLPDNGCKRKFTLLQSFNGHTQSSFARQLAVTVNPDLAANGTANNRYISYEAIDFPVIPADSVALRPDLLENRIVIVGVRDASDIHTTPIGLKPGMEIQAFAVQSLLSESDVSEMPALWLAVIGFLFVYFNQVWQYFFVSYTSSRPTPLFVFLSGSKFMLRLFTFFYMGLITWFGFICYVRFHVYMNLTAVLCAVVLVGETRNFFVALLKALNLGRTRPFYPQTLYP